MCLCGPVALPGNQLLAPPESWLPSLEEKLQALDGLTMRRGDGDDNRSLRQRARAVYVQVRDETGHTTTMRALKDESMRATCFGPS